MTHSSNWTPAGEWYWLFGRIRKISESLHLELQIGHVESRRQRYGIGRYVRLNKPRRGTAPFHFAFAALPDVDLRRIFVVNRLCRYVLQTGLALLMCLVEANLVNATYQNEVCERHQRRRKVGDRNDFEFRVVMTVVTNMDVKRTIEAICDYFNWDDNRVVAAAKSLRFPMFEHLEPAVHQ